MEQKENSLLLPLGLMAAALAIAAGVTWCFYFRSSGAQASGIVTLDGEPVASALVVFVAVDEKTDAALPAPTDDRGYYRILGPTGSGFNPGKYRVVVTKEALKDGTIPSSDKLVQARANGLLANVLPKRYAHRNSTPFEYEVRSGANPINLELKK